MWGKLLELINEELGSPLQPNIWDGIKQKHEEYKLKGEVVVSEEEGKDVWEKSGKAWDDYLQIAEELHDSAESTSTFKKVVAKHCDSSKHAIGHAMLACLPARSSITTNYDTLFELASHGVNAFGGRPYAREKMAVLPFAPKKECMR